MWDSPYGRLLGLPLPGWGVAAFAAAVAAAAGWLAASPHRRPAHRTATLAIAWAGGSFAAYLLLLQAAVLDLWCPWCVAVDTLALAAACTYTVAAWHETAAGPVRRAAWWAPVVAGAVAGLAVAGQHLGSTWQNGALGLAAKPGPGAAVVAGRMPARLEELEPLMAVGPADAPVRIDVYADFQCPYCAKAAREVLPALVAEEVQQGQMRIVFHNFAFLGPESLWAAQAAVCAAVQGRFWAFHDRLFAEQRGENVGSFRPERLVSLARQEGLDVEAFQACLQGPQSRRLVEESFEEGRRRGVRATPTFLVNGEMVEGLVPVEVLRRLAGTAVPAQGAGPPSPQGAGGGGQ